MSEYQKGYIDGTRRAVRIVHEDCQYIMAGVIMTLKEQFGFGEQRLRKAADGIQQFWVNEKERKDAEMGRPDFETTPERVLRLTGIDIVQYDQPLE